MKKIIKLTFVLLLSLSILAPVSMPIVEHSAIAEAASTIKISKKKLNLETGKTDALKISGTQKKVTWSSNNKTVATVSSKGKVRAKTIGVATITATVNSMKLTCKVIVTKPVNPYLENAPFDALEVSFDNLSFVIPVDWYAQVELTAEDKFVFQLYPDNSGSTLMIDITINGIVAPNYSAVKEELAALFTEEDLQQHFQKLLGHSDFEISDFQQSDFKANLINSLKTEYKITVTGVPMKQNIYDFYLDNYFIEITVANAEELDLQSIVEYIMNSLVKL